MRKAKRKAGEKSQAEQQLRTSVTVVSSRFAQVWRPGVSTRVGQAAALNEDNRSDDAAHKARNRDIGVRVGRGRLVVRWRSNSGRTQRRPGGRVRQGLFVPGESGGERRAVGAGVARKGDHEAHESNTFAGSARGPVHDARETGGQRDYARGPVSRAVGAVPHERDGGLARGVRGGRGAQRARVHGAQARVHAGAGAALADCRGPGRGGRGVRDPVARAHGPAGRGQTGRFRTTGAGGGAHARARAQADVAARGHYGQRAAHPGRGDVRGHGEVLRGPGKRP